MTFTQMDSQRSDIPLIAMVCVAHAASHFFQMVFPPLFPWLMEEFSLSFTTVGVLMTAFFFFSGIGQAIAGFAVDRWGGRRVLCFGLLVMSTAAFVLAGSNGLETLFVAAALAGIGNSVFHPADFTLLNKRVSEKNLGHAFSFHGLSGTLGWAVAPVLMYGMASYTGWRTAAITAAILALVIAIFIVYSSSLEYPLSADRRNSNAIGESQGSFNFLGSRTVWMCFVFFLFWTLAFSAIQNFAPTVLNRLYSLPLTFATVAVTVFMVGSALGTVGGGFLVATKSAPDRAVAWALFLAALIALFMASGAPHSDYILMLMAAMGGGTGVAGPSRDMLVRKAAIAGAGSGSFGRIYGFVYSGLDAGLAISPIVFGWLMDASKFTQVMVGVALFQCLALFTATRIGFKSYSQV